MTKGFLEPDELMKCRLRCQVLIQKLPKNLKILDQELHYINDETSLFYDKQKTMNAK